jgi:hypothetical protein
MATTRVLRCQWTVTPTLRHGPPIGTHEPGCRWPFRESRGHEVDNLGVIAANLWHPPVCSSKGADHSYRSSHRPSCAAAFPIKASDYTATWNGFNPQVRPKTRAAVIRPQVDAKANQRILQRPRGWIRSTPTLPAIGILFGKAGRSRP